VCPVVWPTQYAPPHASGDFTCFFLDSESVSYSMQFPTLSIEFFLYFVSVVVLLLLLMV